MQLTLATYNINACIGADGGLQPDRTAVSRMGRDGRYRVVGGTQSAMKRIEILHLTRYAFASPVSLGPHVLLVRPREGHDLRIASSMLAISPKATVTWRRDLYDNVLGVVRFLPQVVFALEIQSRLEVELYDVMPLDFLVETHALHFPFTYRPEEVVCLGPYLSSVYCDHPQLDQWLEPYQSSPAGTS